MPATVLGTSSPGASLRVFQRDSWGHHSFGLSIKKSTAGASPIM